MKIEGGMWWYTSVVPATEGQNEQS
jgi:hypothetical protein